MGRRRRTCRIAGSAGWIAIALLASALWPGAASAAAPVAMDESAQVASSVTVPLEATVAGSTEMTFAVSSNPARGALSQISSPTCQPTGSGSTDCKASVTYTPNQCTNGPDSFTYTATDTGTMMTSSPATVTLSARPAPSPPPEPALQPLAASAAGSTFTGVVGNVRGGTVNWGDDPSYQQVLFADASGNAPLAHVYTAEGSYTLTAANHDGCNTSAVASERVEVVPAGALGLGGATATPGGVATLTLPGSTPASLVLAVAPTDAAPGATILGASYAVTDAQFGLAGPSGLVAAAYDVRAVNASTSDRLTLTFSYADGGVPTAVTVRFFDRVANAWLPIRPSSLVPNSLVVDVPAHRITFVIDDSSFPSLTNLRGTRFAAVGQRPAISRLAVAPRCVSPSAVRSLRLRLTLTQRSTLRIRVHRRVGLRAPSRCSGHEARSTPAGRRVVRLNRRLRPGVYTVSVRARNVHGRSQLASAGFAVAAR